MLVKLFSPAPEAMTPIAGGAGLSDQELIRIERIKRIAPVPIGGWPREQRAV